MCKQHICKYLKSETAYHHVLLRTIIYNVKILIPVMCLNRLHEMLKPQTSLILLNKKNNKWQHKN